MEHSLTWVKSVRRGLTSVLNDWDPIGVSPDLGGPDDEYDYLRDHVLSWLMKGVTRAELIARLRVELDDHFGLPEATVPPDVVDRLLAWWESAR